MKINSTYSVRIREYNHVFEETVEVYRRAVDFFRIIKVGRNILLKYRII